jgi:hypothetical protein
VKKLLVLLATGVLLATPAFAQVITVSTDQTGPAKAGDKVNVCATEDAAVMNVAAFQLTFTFPAGWTVPLSDPKDPSSATFTAGPAAKSASLNIPNYEAANNDLIVGLVGTKNVSGPGQIGCFELDATATAQSGNVGLTASLNDNNSTTVNVSVMGATIQGVPATTATTTTTTGTPTTTTTTGTPTATTTTTTGTATTGGTACPDVKDVTGQISIGDITGNAGQTITIPINVDPSLVGFASSQFVINYDPKVFTFKSSDPMDDSADFKQGPAVAGMAGFLAVNGHATPGQINVALANTKNSTAGGLYLSFPLTILANAPSPTKSEITLTGVTVVDKNSANVAATVGNGVVTVGSCAAATATTTTTTTTTGTTGLGVNSGDVNGSGKVDIDDVKAAINILFGIDTNATDIGAADIDKSGTVDLIDIREILQLAVKNG